MFRTIMEWNIFELEKGKLNTNSILSNKNTHKG